MKVSLGQGQASENQGSSGMIPLMKFFYFLYRRLQLPIASISLFVLFMFPLAGVTADTHATSIAVVNVRYLLQHAPQSEEASKVLKKKFLAKEKELDKEAEAIRAFEESIRQSEGQLTRQEKIEKERELRSRKRTQNRALEDYREDLRLAKSAALDDVQETVFEAIDAVRKDEDIDIVIQDFVSASEKVDITKKVLAYLARKLKEDKSKKKVENKKGGKK